MHNRLRRTCNVSQNRKLTDASQRIKSLSTEMMMAGDNRFHARRV
jgi:hypothetical protein